MSITKDYAQDVGSLQELIQRSVSYPPNFYHCCYTVLSCQIDKDNMIYIRRDFRIRHTTFMILIK